MIKRLLGSYKFAAGNWANRCPTGMFRPRENEFTKGPDSAAKEYFFGADGGPRRHSKVLYTAALGGEEERRHH